MDKVMDWSPQIEAAAVAENDVISITSKIGDLEPNYTGVLFALNVYDLGKVDQSLEVWLFRSNVDIGAANSPESCPAESALEVLTVIPVADTDFDDKGNFSIALKALSDTGMGVGLNGADGKTALYGAVKCTDAGGATYAAGGLKFKLYIGQTRTL